MESLSNHSPESRNNQELITMGRTRREKLFGSILSMPTFNDDNYNLLLDSQRKHVRWLIDQGIVEGKGQDGICFG